MPYLTRLTQIRDELVAVGSKTKDEELARIALNGFSKPWDTFVKGVVAREKLPDWQRLWEWVKGQAHPAVPHRLWIRRL